MANFRKIAEELGLEDVGELEFGEKFCRDCGTRLRVGKEILSKDKAQKIYPREFSYCPQCEKIVELVSVPRFPTRPINFGPHND